MHYQIYRFRRYLLVLLGVLENFGQGSPGISEITWGRFFFLSHLGHPPPSPVMIFQEKHIQTCETELALETS